MVEYKIKSILTKLGKLQEYYYPMHQCSLFCLPDGRLVGNSKLTDHVNILEPIIGKKLETTEFFELMVKTRIVRITMNNFLILYIDVAAPMTSDQIDVLSGLVMCEKYQNVIADSHQNFVPNAPSWKEIRHKLGMSIE